MAEYIKQYRSIMATPMWRDPFFLKFWTLCQFEAETEPREVGTLDGIKMLQAGQFIASRQGLLDNYNRGAPPRFRITWQRMWHYLAIMRRRGYVTIETHNHSHDTYHVVTFVGWDKYYQITG